MHLTESSPHFAFTIGTHGERDIGCHGHGTVDRSDGEEYAAWPCLCLHGKKRHGHAETGFGTDDPHSRGHGTRSPQ